MEIPAHHRAGGAAADDGLPLQGEEIPHNRLVLGRVHGRAYHQVHLLPLADAQGRNGGIVPWDVHVQLPAGVADLRRHGLGGKVRRPNPLGVFGNFRLLPTEVQHRSHPGVDRPVAHHNIQIPGAAHQAGFVDGLAGNLPLFLGVIENLPSPQKDEVRVIELNQIHLPGVLIHLEDGEGAVGHLPHRANRQGEGDGLHAVLHRHVPGQHGGENLGGEGGEDAGLDAASQAVGQHHDDAVLPVHRLHMVAAQKLPRLVHGEPAVFQIELTHGSVPPQRPPGAW